jgi:hypothetical protein
MKFVRAFGRYLLVAVGGIVVILLILTTIYKDRVAEIFIEEISSRSEMEISVSGSRLTLLRRFPRASFELRDILVRSVPAFKGNDTLVSAASASLEFSIFDLLRKRYNIGRITVSGGKVNIHTDQNGITNYPLLEKDSAKTGAGVNINLKNIRLTNIELSVANQVKELLAEMKFNSARLSGEIAGTDIGLRAEGEFEIRRLLLNGIVITNPLDGSLNLDMHKSDSEISLKKGKLTLESMSFAVEGKFTPATGSTNLIVRADNADIAELSGFIPSKYKEFSRYRPSGKVTATCRAVGYITKESMLNYEIDFSVKGARLEIPGTGIRLSDSGLSGYYTNGEENNARSSKLILNSIDLNSGSSFLKGTISLHNFDVLSVQADITTMLDVKELLPILKANSVTGGTGSVRASLQINGAVPGKDQINLRSLLALNPRGNIYLSDLGISVGEYQIGDADGNLMLNESIWVDDLAFTLNGQRALAEGEVTNFLSWAKGNTGTLKIKGSLSANLINPELISGKGSKTAEESAPSLMPPGFEISLSFSTEEFIHKTFTATDVTGVLNYYSNIARLDTFSMNSMGGEVSGSATLLRRQDGSYSSDSRIFYKDVDINKAFISFNNFRQEFIKSENLRGNLSGRYSMRMDIDSMLNPLTSTISSEGQFSILNGELINFEPVKKMSKFIEISELENIKFSQLENEFFIVNQSLAIPQMEIKSSAVDLGISGKHMFNGDYEYHVRLLLSQILSRKAPKRSPNNEFGIVVDDGLGRTSLFLKLTSTGSKETVGYDMAAARTEIRQDLRNEKQNLRTILKEEYGWYGKDTVTTPAQDPVPKPKFNIIWDEGVNSGDTIKPDTRQKDQKGSTVRDLFKKIIKG